MATRAALICNLILAATVLLAGAYPKKEVRNAIEVEDELLEDALSEAEIPETLAEIEKEDLVALRPAGSSLRRRLRRLSERPLSESNRSSLNRRPDYNDNIRWETPEMEV
ncbi:hypothetical protein SprV_0802631100 [Sparganum proliferum]